MLKLFLSEPTWGDDNGKNESYKRIRSLLEELELVIWSLLSSGSRSEARLWLCNTISGISSISPWRQRDLFMNLLRSKPMKRHLASQLLQLIFEKQPQKIGTIIAKKSCKLENFFKGNPGRILQWFSKLPSTGESKHDQGAKALSQFAFVNRDICWDELEWKGKHGQSPAMVAAKPHYFLDLDVQGTVENFLEYVPEFWSSPQFSESLKDEQDLNIFLDLIPKYLKRKSDSLGFGNTSEWFEIILSEYSGASTIDQLLLLNAVTNQCRQLMRLVQEEGSKEEKEKINNLVFQLCESSSCANDLASVMGEDLKKNPLEFVKMLGVYSWAIHFRLAEVLHNPESWESLFISNGINFCKSDKYALLHDDECSEDCGSDSDLRCLKHKKHRKHKKKRKRKFDHAGKCEDELVGYDLSSNRPDLQSKGGDWLLSTDGYSTTWSSVDLPEHLSRHCFITWLKWVLAK